MAIVAGLYTRWFHRSALIAGWAVGMVYGTWVAYQNPKVGDPGSHFGSPLNEFPGTDTLVYIGLTAFLLNLLVSVVGTLVLDRAGVDPGEDQTGPRTTARTSGTKASRQSSPRRPPPTREPHPRRSSEAQVDRLPVLRERQ